MTDVFIAALTGKGLLTLSLAAAGSKGVAEIGGTARAAYTFLVIRGCHVFELEWPTAAKADAAVTFLQSVRDGHPVVEHKTFALPKTVVGIRLLEII